MGLFQSDKLEKNGENDRWTERMADPAEGQILHQPKTAWNEHDSRNSLFYNRFWGTKLSLSVYNRSWKFLFVSFVLLVDQLSVNSIMTLHLFPAWRLWLAWSATWPCAQRTRLLWGTLEWSPVWSTCCSNPTRMPKNMVHPPSRHTRYMRS